MSVVDALATHWQGECQGRVLAVADPLRRLQLLLLCGCLASLIASADPLRTLQLLGLGDYEAAPIPSVDPLRRPLLLCLVICAAGLFIFSRACMFHDVPAFVYCSTFEY